MKFQRNLLNLHEKEILGEGAADYAVTDFFLNLSLQYRVLISLFCAIEHKIILVFITTVEAFMNHWVNLTDRQMLSLIWIDFKAYLYGPIIKMVSIVSDA